MQLIDPLADKLRPPHLALLVAAFLFGLASPAGAVAGTLDQQQATNDGSVGVAPTQSMAQTFTAGQSGLLDQVDLELKTNNSPLSLSVEIRSISSGKPGTQVLAAASLPAASVGTTLGFVPIVFSPAAPVTAGTQYAIVAYTASTAGNSYSWADKSGDPYASGSEAVSFSSPPVNWALNAGLDLAFKTYVVPQASSAPPPPTGQRAGALRKCKKKFKKNHSKKKLKRCKKKAKLLPL